MSLRTKFLLISVVLIVLLGSSITIFVQTFLSQKLTTELQKSGILIAENIVARSITPILTGDNFPLQLLVIDDKEFHEDIEYIFILDHDNNILAHTFGDAFPMNLKGANTIKANQTHQIQSLITEKGDLFDIAVPILKGEVGVVHIGILEEPIRKTISNITNQIIWTIIVFLILGCSLMAVFATTITTPIFELIKDTKIIGSGNLGHKIPIKTNDEIGQLAVSFGKMAESLQKITVSKSYVDDIFQSMTDSLVVVNPDATIRSVNQTTLHLLDYEEEELVGKPVEDIIKEEEQRLFQGTVIEAMIEKEKFTNLELNYLTKDGGEIPVLFSCSVMRNDEEQIQGIICVAQDITERKQAEEKFHQVSDFNALLIYAAPTIILALDTEGKIVQLNRYLEELSGYCEEDLIGKNWLETFMPKHAHKLVQQTFDKAIQNISTQNYVNAIQTKDGQERIIRWYNTSLTDEKKNVKGVLAIGQDITERRELERNFANVAVREMQNIGHELHDSLGQELAGISLLAHSLHDKLEKRFGGGVESEKAAVIMRQIHQAKATLRRLIDGVRPVQIDVESLVQELEDLAKRITDDSGANCSFSCTGNPFIRDNQTAIQVYYIAREAAFNAAKFAKATEIIIFLEQDNHNFTLRISDDGIGLPKDWGKQAGAGLRIMKYRAEVLGATFIIESTPGKGTLVECSLLG